MNLRTAIAACCMAATPIVAQAVTFVGNGVSGSGIGSPQVVPDPFDATAPSGTLDLFVDLCSGPSLYAYATGLPQGYLHGAITQETMVFILNVGNAATPGVTILGGDFLIPLSPTPISYIIGPATYIGPVGCGTGAGSFGATLYGAFLDISSLIQPTFQNVSLSMQATMLDSVLNQVFTSNGVNFQV